MVERKEYTTGAMIDTWGNGAQNLTFIVTEDCNLRCKYCYVTHKTKGKRLDIETAKKFIDYILTTEQIVKPEAVVLDFIGGEPLLEAELIEEICDYFKIRAYEEGVSWYWNYRINISTNGINYDDEKVQRLIKKNEDKISIGITIDGTKEKHDLQRVFPDGSGSYNAVYRNIKLWLQQFPGSTKVTFASEDLKFLKESIIHLWNEGIYDIAANVVYEDVWKPGDDLIFETQLKELADYIIENELYNKYRCTLFLDFIGRPFEKEELMITYCGAGKMLALGPDGNIYPCMRYYDYSLNKKRGYIIGNVREGIDFEKVRVFLAVANWNQCTQECIECPVAQGCGSCQGFSYDESDTGTNFQRATYICKMHKARVRANNYYFAKLYHKKGIKRKGFFWKRQLYFLLGEDYSSICSYKNSVLSSEKIMPISILEAGLRFAEENFMQPVFLHSKKIENVFLKDYEEIEILHWVPIEAYDEVLPFYDYRLIVGSDSLKLLENIPKQEILIFNISEKEIGNLAEYVEVLLKKCFRINVNIQGLSSEFNLGEYRIQLEKCADFLIRDFYEGGVLKEINVITDLLYINEAEGCSAGNDTFTLGPDGKIYICPAFYSGIGEAVGDLKQGIELKNGHLFKKEYMPLCQKCDAFQCENCKYINYMATNEVNVSPSYQCVKAQIERSVSARVKKMLSGKMSFENNLADEPIIDPIENIRKCGGYMGYYKEKVYNV